MKKFNFNDNLKEKGNKSARKDTKKHKNLNSKVLDKKILKVQVNQGDNGEKERGTVASKEEGEKEVKGRENLSV